MQTFFSGDVVPFDELNALWVLKNFKGRLIACFFLMIALHFESNMDGEVDRLQVWFQFMS